MQNTFTGVSYNSSGETFSRGPPTTLHGSPSPRGLNRVKASSPASPAPTTYFLPLNPVSRRSTSLIFQCSPHSLLTPESPSRGTSFSGRTQGPGLSNGSVARHGDQPGPPSLARPLHFERTELVLSSTCFPFGPGRCGVQLYRGTRLPSAMSLCFPRSNCLAVISFNDITRT